MRFAVEVIYQGRVETIYVNAGGNCSAKSVAENTRPGNRVLSVRASG